jgi:cytoskeletal protein CcmA (bactofilin family)
LGNLDLKGGAQIDGSVAGEISAEGELVIGESAQVKAAIQGEQVRVFGRVIGDIVCSERLELFSGARVTGNISSPRLIIHDGVIFDGSCQMEQQRLARLDGQTAEAGSKISDLSPSARNSGEKED